jgi:2-polyprenyl-3-methyl-5-hydroxy-6-metoxy-1,4-benzoquinol methylase
MVEGSLSREQSTQEAQYALPYHYVPERDGLCVSRTVFWSWGMHYLAGMELVLSELKKLTFDSLLDVGCGDGRFLKEVTSEFMGKEVLGVDYSTRAIALAKALNPAIDYICADLTSETLQQRYDVVTAVEVLEHIPVDEVQLFLEGIASHLNPEGRLVITVPHVNKGVQSKHYQHFTAATLRATLQQRFTVQRVVPFDRRSRLVAGMLRLLGHTGSRFIVTHQALNRLAYKMILKGCLEEQPEGRCSRLLAVATAKV